MNIISETSMRVALAKVEIVFPHCHSLKEKRQQLRKLKDQVFSRFKIPVHEVDHHDKWQRAQLGFALVGNDSQGLASLKDKIVNHLASMVDGDIVDVYSEIISF